MIARSEATWQSPYIYGLYVKRTNALTNRPELLGDCHDQSADWSRNDSSNERANNNLSYPFIQQKSRTHREKGALSLSLGKEIVSRPFIAPMRSGSSH